MTISPVLQNPRLGITEVKTKQNETKMKKIPCNISLKYNLLKKKNSIPLNPLTST